VPSTSVKIKSVSAMQAIKSLDPKVKNVIKFLVMSIVGLSVLLYLFLKYSGESDPLRIIGIMTLLIAIWRTLLAIYRRILQPPKKPTSYGKWAIVTGSTSGIGKEFASYLAKQGMSILLISRSEDKLKEQVEEIKRIKEVDVKYIAYDFTIGGQVKEKFYEDLNKLCIFMKQNGGIGVLVNNVGVANETPKFLEELSDKDVDDMISCNILSVVYMTRCVLPHLKEQKKGAIINVSSGSGNFPAPLISVYASTKYGCFSISSRAALILSYIFFSGLL
jgi:17beta-estradiol 17-dehydrogenase / very-long-chain 3-oxoacyl-CoA reductase